MMWIQDFPLRSTGAKNAEDLSSDADSPNPFFSTLKGLLDDLGVPRQFASRLGNYDFTSAKARCVLSRRQLVVPLLTSLRPIVSFRRGRRPCQVSNR